MYTEFYREKKILVTGASGFVGTHLIKHLLKYDAKITAVTHQRNMILTDKRITCIMANLNNFDECLAITKNMDFVFHAAGSVGAAGVQNDIIMTGIRLNLGMTMNVLEANWVNRVKRCLLFSSSTGYPEKQSPVNEDDFWRGDVYTGYLGYGWMRRYVEKLGEFVNRDSNTSIITIRPTAIYGRYDNFTPGSSHVIPALIHKATIGNNPIEIWGNGEEVRDFLHVDDLAAGSILAFEKLPAGNCINIGSGHEYTIGQVARSILRAAGRDFTGIKYNSNKPSALPYRAVDCSKARKQLGFSPKIDLEEGLKDTVSWYNDQYNRGKSS